MLVALRARTARIDILLLVAISWLAGNSVAGAADGLEFNRDVRPILSENCFHCHGPDKNKREADLRLDTQAGLLGDGKTPGAVVPRDVANSELIRRIKSTDPEEQMPPPHANKKLTAAEVAVLEKWVEQGATWQGHWAYQPPQRAAPPEVNNPFVRNELDRFVLQKLEQAKLKPAPEADRATLIRRLTLDLTGLPPEPADVAAFVSDTQPDAYERVVERLLASPQFGERMAIYWLDLVRFADTIGYHSDNTRDITPYRDYVIQAFNNNLPFDQFTIEQLAGDLLPQPTLQQQVASGYNRLLQTTEEGGAQAKEYAAKYAADRVRNVASVWLGATMGCCECHDHKYDPYSIRDFYSMAAFFADVQEAAVGRREAGMLVPTAEQAQALAQQESLIAAAKAELDPNHANWTAPRQAWEEKLLALPRAPWQVLTPTAVQSDGDVTLQIVAKNQIAAKGRNAAQAKYTIDLASSLEQFNTLRLDALTDKSLPQQGPGRGKQGEFIVRTVVLQVADGPEAEFRTVAFKSAVGSSTTTDAAAILEEKPKSPGWTNGKQAGTDVSLVLELVEPLTLSATSRLRLVLDQGNRQNQTLGKLRVSAVQATEPVVLNAREELPLPIAEILAIIAAERTPEQQTELAQYFVQHAEVAQAAREKLAQQEKALTELQNQIPRSLVAKSGPPRMTRILVRGNWLDDSGEVVQPAIPEFLGKLPTESRRATRLDLARWMVSAENPLTSRVFVNRLWKIYFGAGLSKSLEDLGSQGEWPTHPELLDWLACEFREQGWNVKQMVRLMVLSGTYRQSSKLTPEARAVDPYNRLLSAQGRFRLDAEVLRDQALAISGLLSRQIGGASVMPYQPEGYWDYLNFPRRTYQHDRGEKLYRRGLYTHWQRSFLHPSLLAFDAPSREECTAERPKSSTPQQALVLLNDPTYVEAARVFAVQIVQTGGATPDARLTWAFKKTLAREPRADELAILSKLLTQQLSEYHANPAAAQQLLRVGDTAPATGMNEPELAAYTAIARVLFNLHETVSRY